MEIARNFNAFGRYEVVPFHGECYLHSTLPSSLFPGPVRFSSPIEICKIDAFEHDGKRNNIWKPLNALVPQKQHNTRNFVNMKSGTMKYEPLSMFHFVALILSTLIYLIDTRFNNNKKFTFAHLLGSCHDFSTKSMHNLSGWESCVSKPLKVVSFCTSGFCSYGSTFKVLRFKLNLNEVK